MTPATFTALWLFVTVAASPVPSITKVVVAAVAAFVFTAQALFDWRYPEKLERGKPEAPTATAYVLIGVTTWMLIITWPLVDTGVVLAALLVFATLGFVGSRHRRKGGRLG